MKLVLTLLVRDEEDIIYENILYHLNQGVDFIIVTDNRSVDGTMDILRDFLRQGVLALFHEEEDTFSQYRWVSRMARLAKVEYNADWVINSDADEFWWPKAGNLKQVVELVPADFSSIEVERHNFCPLKEAVGPWYENMVFRTIVSVNPLGGLLPPKICHRGLADVEVDQGNHTLKWPKGLRSFPEKPIEILHFPIRSSAQFENKIVKGGAAYERNRELKKKIGHCWRKLYTKWKRGRLDDFLSGQFLTKEQIQCGLREGSLVLDTRLRDFLRGLTRGTML